MHALSSQFNQNPDLPDPDDLAEEIAASGRGNEPLRKRLISGEIPVLNPTSASAEPDNVPISGTRMVNAAVQAATLEKEQIIDAIKKDKFRTKQILVPLIRTHGYAEALFSLKSNSKDFIELCLSIQQELLSDPNLEKEHGRLRYPDFNQEEPGKPLRLISYYDFIQSFTPIEWEEVCREIVATLPQIYRSQPE